MKSLVIAVDFDGTLCEYGFPNIGEQKEKHKELLSLLLKLKAEGHKLVLWTNRGDNEKYKSLTEAIEWCSQRGLSFDAVNKNLPEKEQAKLSGYSPKIIADIYIDDRALPFGTEDQMGTSLLHLRKLLSTAP